MRTASLRQATALTLTALFVLSCVPRTHAHRFKSAPPEPTQSLFGFTAAVDLDADITQDRLILRANGYEKTIKISFGNSRAQDLGFTPGSIDVGSLVVRDIDRDGDVDLVWIGGIDRKDAVVWMNDGDGNFAEVADNSPYASELDELFGGSGPSGNRSLKRKRKSSSVISSSFHDVGPPILVGLRLPTAGTVAPSAPQRLNFQSLFSPYLHKRGPPLRLS